MRGSTRFWRKVRKTDGCWLWAGPMLRGQPVSPIRGMSIQRFALRDKYGAIHSHDHIENSCGNPLCVKPSHLHFSKGGPRGMIREGSRRYYQNAIEAMTKDLENELKRIQMD